MRISPHNTEFGLNENSLENAIESLLVQDDHEKDD
jgi:hypothetical protein